MFYFFSNYGKRLVYCFYYYFFIVNAGINAFMSIFNGSGSYFFLSKDGYDAVCEEKMDGEMYFFPPESALSHC